MTLFKSSLDQVIFQMLYIYIPVSSGRYIDRMQQNKGKVSLCLTYSLYHGIRRYDYVLCTQVLLQNSTNNSCIHLFISLRVYYQIYAFLSSYFTLMNMYPKIRSLSEYTIIIQFLSLIMLFSCCTFFFISFVLKMIEFIR